MNAAIRGMIGVCSAAGLLLLAGGAVNADDATRSKTVRLERTDAASDRAATARTRSLENQNIVIERTGEPRIEVTSRNGLVVVKVDGAERVRAEPDDEWRSTEIHNDAGELIARITRDPATGRVSVDGPGMHARPKLDPEELGMFLGPEEIGMLLGPKEFRKLPQLNFFSRTVTPEIERTYAWRPFLHDGVWRTDLLSETTPALPVMMGIMMGAVDGALAHHLGIEPGTATLVTGLVPGSPAEQAGLQEHDIVLTLDGNTAGPNNIHTLLSTKSPGDAVTLRVRRAGEPQPKTVTIELARSTRAMSNAFPSQQFTPPGRRSAAELSALGSRERQMLRQAAPEPPRTPESPESFTRGRAQDSDATRKLQDEIRALQEQIRAAQWVAKGQSKQATLDQAVENIATMSRELAQKQAELARLRSERIMQQFEAMGAQQGDIDFTMPRMLIEMMLEEEGQPAGRRYVFQAPGQVRAGDLESADAAMRLLAEEMRAAAVAERDRLREALSTSRDREQELTDRLDRMERQLQSLMAALERVVGTQADGVKPGDRSPE